jgi:hypothetical protein
VSSGAIGLADTRPLARAATSTRLVRAIAAAGAVAAATFALTAALREPPASAGLLPAGSDGVVVLDLSASIPPQTYRRVALTLDRLARSNGRYGLVVFSDTAYLALPPRTPARELRTFERFFRVPPRSGGILGTPAENPWTHGFSAGTRISTGLSVALEAIRRDRLSEPAVLLVSDLDNEIRDIEPLARVAVEYRERRIPLHVVALDAAPEDRRTLESLVGRPADVVDAPDPRTAGTLGERRRDRTPVVAAGVAAAFLALLVVVGGRLRWSAA